MDAPARTKARRQRGASFDVTCTIGTVLLDGSGEESASVAAFKLIAEHDAPGEYSFPLADGRTCAVTVDHVDEGGSNGTTT